MTDKGYEVINNDFDSKTKSLSLEIAEITFKPLLLP